MLATIRAAAPRSWAVSAFWLKLHPPLMPTTALPLTMAGLTPAELHSSLDDKFTRGYAV